MNLRTFAIGMIATIAISHSVIADPVKRAKETIGLDGATRLVLEADFGAGEFLIQPRSMEEAAIIEIEYTPKSVRYDVEFYKRGETGYLELESNHRRHWDDDSENNWRVELSDRYPMAIDFDIGACEAKFDFGGIPITELVLDIGASSGVIEFSKPNPERIDVIDIDVGASSLELRNFGNANFERFNFSIGAASAELDLEGAFSGESIIDLDVGVGSLDVIVPEGIAVRLEVDDDGWFSSIDFDDLDLERVRRDIYESPNFESAGNRVIIRLDIGMGSVDFYRRR